MTMISKRCDEFRAAADALETLLHSNGNDVRLDEKAVSAFARQWFGAMRELLGNLEADSDYLDQEDAVIDGIWHAFGDRRDAEDDTPRAAKALRDRYADMAGRI